MGNFFFFFFFFFFFHLKMGFKLVLFISFLCEFGVNTVNKILVYLPELGSECSFVLC